MRGAALAATMKRPARQPRGMVADNAVIAYLLAVFFLTAAAAVGVAAYMHRPPQPAVEVVRFVVGTTGLDVPVNWLRPGMARAGGRVERLDLVIPWPNGQAAPRPEAQAGSPMRAIEHVVLVSLVPADDALAPADRPVKLYARFLNGEVWPNPGGLILRRFRTGTPYEDENLYVSPPDGRDFAARCPRFQPAAVLKEGCVAELRVGMLDAQLRFAPARLVAWERLSEGVRRAISAMTRGAP